MQSRYRIKIHDKWKEITESTATLVSSSGPEHTFSRFVNDTETFIKAAVGVPEEDYEEDILGTDVEAELHRLNIKYRKLQEQMLSDQLANNVIEEQEDVVRIMGQPRIELVCAPPSQTVLRAHTRYPVYDAPPLHLALQLRCQVRRHGRRRHCSPSRSRVRRG